MTNPPTPQIDTIREWMEVTHQALVGVQNSLFQIQQELTTVNLAAALYTQTTPRIPYALQLRTELETLNAALASVNLSDALYTQTLPRLPYLKEVRDTLESANAALGGAPYQDLNIATIRGLLHAVLTTLSALPGAYVWPPAGYEDAYQSNGGNRMHLETWLGAGMGISRIRWPGEGVPSGIVWENLVTLYSVDWSQFKIFVHTHGSKAFGIKTNDFNPIELFYPDGSRYYTEQWVQLSGSGNRQFYVDGDEEVYAVIAGADTNPGDEDEDDDDTNLLDPPTDLCLAIQQELIRASDWQYIGEREGLSIWRPYFDPAAINAIALPDRDHIAYAHQAGQQWRYCMVWNFSGLNYNEVWHRNINDGGNSDTNTFYTGRYYEGAIASDSWDIDPGYVWFPQFGFPIADGKPPLNIWCKGTLL